MFIWSWSFAVFDPACVKKPGSTWFLEEKERERERQKFQLVFCMCVCASLHTKKLLKEREREKSFNSIFYCFVCVCMCVCVCVCVCVQVWAFEWEREREKEKTKDQLDFWHFVVVREIPYFGKTYFLTLKKLISPLSENLFPYKHKYPTDGSELEHIKLRINKF